MLGRPWIIALMMIKLSIYNTLMNPAQAVSYKFRSDKNMGNDPYANEFVRRCSKFGNDLTATKAVGCLSGIVKKDPRSINNTFMSPEQAASYKLAWNKSKGNDPYSDEFMSKCSKFGNDPTGFVKCLRDIVVKTPRSLSNGVESISDPEAFELATDEFQRKCGRLGYTAPDGFFECLRDILEHDPSILRLLTKDKLLEDDPDILQLLAKDDL
jgi:hypothetical protein